MEILSRTRSAIMLCVSAILVFPIWLFSCRKPDMKEFENNQPFNSAVNIVLTIDLSDVVEKLPQTMLYNIKEANLYLDKAEWKYDDEGLILRIPTTEGNNKFLYARKTYANPRTTDVYAVVFDLDSSVVGTGFTGKEIWINFQDWTAYGIQYQNDVAIAYMSPQVLAVPNWEQILVQSKHFLIDNNDKIQIKTDCVAAHPDPYEPATPFGGGIPCPKNVNGDDGNWLGGVFDNMGDFFTKVGGALGDLMGESNGSGIGGGWNWGSGYWGPNPGASSGEPGGGGGGSWGPKANGELPVAIKGNGTSGGTIPLFDIPDQNGFLPSRKLALKLFLQAKPAGMIDCNDLSTLPMGMYQQVGSYNVPQVVLNRLDQIRNMQSGTSYSSLYFDVQDINSASGGVVNCDYFAVHIATLPKYTTGIVMTPDEFLEYFRLNINSFTGQTANGTQFSPYQHSANYLSGPVHIYDAPKFNSSYENSLGALIHIAIPISEDPRFHVSNDGSVVESGYIRNSSNNHHWFMFTTMKTPLDGEHPVAGNRKFGIFPDPNGGYCFYTMGVDRLNNSSLALVDWGNTATNAAFAGGDQLWTGMIAKTVININGWQGAANAYPPAIIRPKWNTVAEFLKGHITLSQLKIALNCP